MIARSYLYVPANNLVMLKKAVNRGADALIVDLEDSVAAGDKELARQNLVSWLSDLETSTQIWVRINAESIDEDLAFTSSEKIHGLVIPKATVENVNYVADKLNGKHVLSALIESAESVLDAHRIATISSVAFLQIGILDLRAEMGLSEEEDLGTIHFALSHLVLASAAAGINQPIAPMFRDFNDLEALKESCKRMRANGFFGRSCIHPKQIETINSEFNTSAEALLEAREVLDAIAKSQGVALDSKGRMIDKASERIAKRVIESSRER
jgi:citrate lyase subunit beta/citryl-CoA lyase